MKKKTQEEILQDYKIVYTSRQASLLGRKEVLTGKAKFGIFGDGKELAQVALAKTFKKGDWRSGYYRDQTLMMALGLLSVRQFFAQLFADTNPEHEPHSAGRQMNNHFATRYIAENGEWLDQLTQPQSSSDISPTAGQMARLLGLAYASKLYRENPRLNHSEKFSNQGNEVAFGTIGNASTSEGHFWEAINAAGVLKVPLAMSVWDDHYGISVANEFQTTKGSISEVLAGFKTSEKGGIDIYQAKGWDYAELCEVYEQGVDRVRKDHHAALFHISEITQPQGHSTSGSHERYKSKERLVYESEMDCLVQFRKYILKNKFANESEITALEKEIEAFTAAEKDSAWTAYIKPLEAEREVLLEIFEQEKNAEIKNLAQELTKNPNLYRRNILSAARKAVIYLESDSPISKSLAEFIQNYSAENNQRYSKFLHVESSRSPLKISVTEPIFTDQKVDGRVVIQKFFDAAIAQDPRIFIIGEDIGKLGGVNLEFDGLQEKYGILHVSDTGIREATILGQGIGAAMRGLKPIVDIQYLDYLLYCFQGLSDDLATLHYRSAGAQLAPVIIRTKGHRLEGVWHTGSPMAMILGGARGLHICVPRNMVQASGMYRTLLSGDDPALVIEPLNGYRLKELLPQNIGQYSVALGEVEILEQGHDITLVTYGSCVRVASEATKFLRNLNIEVELVDIQTLLPFDLEKKIAKSVAKTNAVLFLDEDVPGGATAYMLRHVLADCFHDLDCAPRTLSAKPHRSPYGSDGDYFSKPNAEDIIEMCIGIIDERSPGHRTAHKRGSA